MQYACGIADATGIHRHIDDLLLDLRQEASIGIGQEKRSSTPEAARTAPILYAMARRLRASNATGAARVASGADERFSSSIPMPVSCLRSNNRLSTWR